MFTRHRPRIGDIVRLKIYNNKTLAIEIAPLDEEWARAGIILDVMEMPDGFYMIEVNFGTSIEWFQDLELELAELVA